MWATFLQFSWFWKKRTTKVTVLFFFGLVLTSDAPYKTQQMFFIFFTPPVHSTVIDIVYSLGAVYCLIFIFLYFLGKRGDSDKDSLKSYSNSDTDEKNNDKSASQIVGNKHPKDDSQIIEELKVLSGQLRNSVQTLLIQLDERNKEIEKLKATIQLLEDEKVKGREFYTMIWHYFYLEMTDS